ncbi:MAG: hypothetical protein ING19_18925 [Azospirillum sp.]|nr:hypothetical protein [Azospirillum sp.]
MELFGFRQCHQGHRRRLAKRPHGGRRRHPEIRTADFSGGPFIDENDARFRAERQAVRHFEHLSQDDHAGLRAAFDQSSRMGDSRIGVGFDRIRDESAGVVLPGASERNGVSDCEFRQFDGRYGKSVAETEFAVTGLHLRDGDRHRFSGLLGPRHGNRTKPKRSPFRSASGIP